MKENGAHYGWKHKTEKIKTKLNITPEDMQGSKEQTKNTARAKVKIRFTEEIEICGRDKSKVRYLLDEKKKNGAQGNHPTTC